MVVKPSFIFSQQDTSKSSCSTGINNPLPNVPQILAVANYKASTPTPATPTVTGNGLTWVQIATVAASADYRLTLFRAVGAAPTSGPLTIDFGGVVQDNILWGLAEFKNVNVSNSGANLIVQSGTGSVAPATSLTITLSAFTSAINLAYGVIYTNGVLSFTEGSGFTNLINNTGFHTMEAEYKENDNTVDWTFSSSPAIAIAVEIKAKKAGGFVI